MFMMIGVIAAALAVPGAAQARQYGQLHITTDTTLTDPYYCLDRSVE
jgi:hypothetical protein